MIWYNEKIEVPNQPPGAYVALVGQFILSNDSAPPISIRLEYSRNADDTLTHVVLFTHTPSGVMTEEPSPEEILNKYRNKIVKAKKRISETPFDLLNSIRPIA